jgi:cytidine deaminase
MNSEFKGLLEKAKQARETAYAPYSNFQVGVAVLANSKIFTGGNQENACSRLGVCAEQSAFSSIPQTDLTDSAGKSLVTAIVVIGSADEFTSPCGGCRQLFVQFCHPDTPVWMVNRSADVVQESTVGELLPYAFRL